MALSDRDYMRRGQQTPTRRDPRGRPGAGARWRFKIWLLLRAVRDKLPGKRER